MEKPYLIVVTGRPGAGKTTLAQALGAEMRLPVIGRDQLKEGYVHTRGRGHSALPDETNRVVTDIFFDTIGELVERDVSLIAEAAFQHAIWAARLAPLAEKARLRLVICQPGERLALERYLSRGLSDPMREYFHGDPGVKEAKNGAMPRITPYEEPRLDVPTFSVDTSGAYRPSLSALAPLLLGRANDSAYE